jgi:antitoxin ParD1/3/4
LTLLVIGGYAERNKRRGPTMNVSLTPELEQYVATKVSSGMYQTASEVIREALRLLRERDDLQQQKLDELRREIAVGLEQANQGKVVPLTEETVEQIKARGRTRRQGKASPS